MGGEALSSSPPWEKVLVTKIRAMSATEKSMLLEAICHCIQEHSQVGPRVTLVPMKHALTPPTSATPGLRGVGPAPPPGSHHPLPSLNMRGGHPPLVLDATAGACQPGTGPDATWSLAHAVPMGLRGSRGPSGASPPLYPGKSPPARASRDCS